MKLLALVLITLSAVAAASEDRNGYWWSDKSREEKQCYILGLWDAYSTVLGTVKLTQAQRSALASKTADAGTLGQFTTGLDEFYKDYRNLQIATPLAIQYVNDELRGAEPKILDAELRLMRAAASASIADGLKKLH